MCGIFGFVGHRPRPAQAVLEGLKKLEYRGYDSWGIAVKNGKGIYTDKFVGKIGAAETALPDTPIGLGHTRWATHGGVTQRNAHPHTDCTGRLALVHNGIVENYLSLKRELQARGHRLVSDTDTEVIVHMVEAERAAGASLGEATQRAFRRLEGLNAIILLDASSDQLVAAKSGSPLIVGLGEGENFVASDVTALVDHTRRVIFLEDNQMAVLTRHGVDCFRLDDSQPFTPKVEEITWTVEDADRGEYPHFMAKEMAEQPRVLVSIAQNYTDQILQLADLIRTSYGCFMVGCGTAFHATLAGQYLFSRIARRHVNSITGSEFGYQEHFLTPRSLVIALSQSGETIDVLESVGAAQKKGAKIVALVNVIGSSLYRLADFRVPLGAGPEKCVLSTKTFTAKLAILLLTAYALRGEIETGKDLLMRCAREVANLLESDFVDRIQAVAATVSEREHMFVVGRGPHYPIALEAALKIKEVSYLHAEGFAGGELKHGVIALVEEGTPCLVFAPNDETRAGALSGAMEMRARGGYIIGVSPTNDEAFHVHLPVVDVGEAAPLLNVVPAQLLGYELALRRGHDPDKPRNLAKSVTVK